jgi:selenocysteine lyase/cysteine desulfurase
MAGTAAAVDYFATIGAAQVPGDRRTQLEAALNLFFDYEQTLASRLIDGLQQLPGVKVQGITDADAMRRRVPTVSFTHGRHAPAEIAEAMAQRNIFVWSGHNYALEAAKALGIDGAVRIGAVHYNSVGEIDTVLEALEQLLT